MTRIELSLAFALILPWIGPASADMFAPSHSCFQPSRPYEFRDEWERDNFLSDVDTYRACIEDFIEEQNEAANGHQQASEDAVDEWNNFVAYELN